MEGNKHSVLNLLWHTICHYQITDAGHGPKSLLLDVIQACLPEKAISNFTTDWTNGFVLSTLINFCDSSLIIDHKYLDEDYALQNVEDALKIAKENLGVPHLLDADDMATEKTDERSIMVYLSHFCVGPQSPIQKKFLEWIQKVAGDESITNFSDNWIDGKKLGALAQALSPDGFGDLEGVGGKGVSNVSYCKEVMESADQLLGIDMTITPDNFARHSLNPVLRLLYLMQFYFCANEVQVGKLQVPKEPGPGATVWLDITVPMDAANKIHASADGKLAGNVPVEIQETDDGHRIQFNAEVQDSYTLNVTVGNLRVKGSPFLIDLTPPDPSLVTVMNISALPKKAGIPIILTLNTAEAGHGGITAEALGADEEDEVPSSVDEMGHSMYKVSFIPMQAEKYTLDVRMDGQHIKGSPFSFDLSGLIHPEAVQIERPIKGGVGNPVRIPINMGMAGNAKLEARCVGKKTGEIEVTYDSPSQPTEISFIPPEEDVYTVSIIFDGTEVIDSPFEVNLIPVPPDAKSVRLVRPPSNSVKGQDQIRMGFNTADSGDGAMTASCSGAKVGDIQVTINTVSPDEYEVLFTPTDSDEYTVNVLWADDHVSGSPFRMRLKPKDYPEPTKCEVHGFPSSDKLLLVGEPFSFKVDTRNAGKGVLDAMVEVSKPIRKQEDDQVSMMSTTTRDSDTISRITAMEEDRELEPIAEDREVQVGQEKVMRIRANSSLGGGGGERKRRLDHAESKTSVSELEWAREMDVDNILEFEDEETAKLTIEQEEETAGIYKVTYLPVIEGVHTVNVYWSDMPLPHFPMSVKVVKPQVAFYKEPVAVEVHTSYKRKQLKTRVDLHDGGNIKGIQVRMDKVKTGHYFLVFTPPHPGIYLLHVSAKKKYLSSSPYIINYLKPAGPLNEQVKVNNLSDRAYIGQPFSFLVKAEDSSSLHNLLSVSRQDQQQGDDEEETGPVQLEPVQDGSVRVIFTPSTSGEEKVTVKVGGAPIPGSPFMVTILEEEGDDDTVTPCVSPPVEPPIHVEEKKDKTKKKKKESFFSVNLNDQKFTVGTPCKFKVDCRELRGSGNFQVMCKPSAAAEISVTDTSEPKLHSVEVMPKKPGKCELTVRQGAEDVPGSPFGLHILARGSADKCVLLETSDYPQSNGDEKIFAVSTKGAGKGRLTAFIKSLSTDKEIPVTVELESKHLHLLKFTPSEGLNYTLTIRFDEIDITGSPFKLLLGNPSLTTVEGSGLTKAWSGRNNSFYVFSDNSGPGELTVYIESEEEDLFNTKASKVEATVTQLEEFKHEVTYQPKNPGIYWVSVKWKHVHIPGSPYKAFCLKPLSPNQLSIADPAPFTHHEKPAKFLVVVDKTIHEDDKLTVAMYDSDNNMVPGEVTRRNDTSYSMTLRPPKLGSYSVFVLWDKQHIIGSPFQIENVEPPKATELTIDNVREEDGTVTARINGPLLSFRYGQLMAYLTMYRSEEDSYLASDIHTDVETRSHSESLVKFTPDPKQKYQLNIWYDSEHIKGSPFALVSTDASQCRSSGMGLKQAQAHRSNKFTVFTENAGHGELQVNISGQVDEGDDDGGSLDVTPEVTSLDNGKVHNVSYVAPKPGRYSISIQWDRQHIKGSPFEVMCCDPLRYKILSPPRETILTRPLKFGIRQASQPPSHEQLVAFARGRDGARHQGNITRGKDRDLICSVLSPELGLYLVQVQCNGFEIDGSPFKIKTLPSPVPANVAVSGPGLTDECLVGEKGTFNIDVTTAGYSFISLKVQGPQNGFRVDLNQDQDRKGVVIAEYNPAYPGTYSLNIFWDGKHVPNSPFTVHVKEAIQSTTPTAVTMESVR